MPAVNVSPFGPRPQFELSDGTPAVGGKLFFYVAGSVNTKQSTYTNSTGAVANTNPLVLNVLGMPATEIWLQSGLAYKVVYAPSTDSDPPSSPIWSVDQLRGVNDTAVASDQWVNPGFTPTYIGATSFSLAGDQTSAFHAGRRLRTTNSGGTIYSTIVSSVFGALTTVTVVNDSGVLDAGLSAVSYGLLSAVNPSAPLPAAATQAQQEAGTSTVVMVTPSNQKSHPSAAKFWAYFGITGNLLAGYNIASITDNGPGDATVTVTVPFSTAAWPPWVTAGCGGAAQFQNCYTVLASQIRVQNFNLAGANVDPPDNWWSVGGFGDQ